MPHCMYCGRDELPRLPMMPHRVDVVAAHAKNNGEPCGQGGCGELPPDYPRDELVSDDGWWDLGADPVFDYKKPDGTLRDEKILPIPISLAQAAKRARSRKKGKT